MLIEAAIIHKNDNEQIKQLSLDVVDCMEMLDAFSIDGKYENITESEKRMPLETAQRIKDCYYSVFAYAYSKKRIKVKHIKRKLKPIKNFIVGIYKHGTPSYRFKSMRIEDAVSDDYIMEQFATALLEKLKNII